MVPTIIAMIQRLLAPRRARDDAPPDSISSATAAGGPDQQGQEEEGSQAELLARHIEERQRLTHNAKLAAILIGVLLVLNIEATPLVVADFHLQDQYGDQVRSLVLVEGLVARLAEVASSGAPLWEQRLDEQVETAMRQINDLNAYDQLLVTTDGLAPNQPEFLQSCSRRDPEVAASIQTSTDLRRNWPLVVERCIIERMGPGFDADGQDQFTASLTAAHADVTVAIAQARREFPLAAMATSPPSEPSPTPTVELIARQAFDEIEDSVNHVVRIVKAGPEEAISPPPTLWLTQFTGEDGSLQSFRDNMLLTYANPYGATTTRPGDPKRLLAFSPLEVSAQGAQGLKTALETVRESQATLQERIQVRTADLESAIPDFFKPVLIVAKPMYLVLFFPLAVALLGGYFLLTYARLQWDAYALRAAGASDVQPQPLALFVALALVPLFLLLSLVPAYDWPQFAYGWWQWSHRGPLALFLVIALWYAFNVRAAIGHGSDSRPGAEPRVTAPTVPQSESSPQSRPSATRDGDLGQPNLGSHEA